MERSSIPELGIDSVPYLAMFSVNISKISYKLEKGKNTELDEGSCY